jgi:hypothetical protein
MKISIFLTLFLLIGNMVFAASTATTPNAAIPAVPARHPSATPLPTCAGLAIPSKCASKEHALALLNQIPVPAAGHLDLCKGFQERQREAITQACQ